MCPQANLAGCTQVCRQTAQSSDDDEEDGEGDDVSTGPSALAAILQVHPYYSYEGIQLTSA